MEIVLLLFLVLLNGVFAMSEIALLTARRARLQARADDGDTGAAVALALGDEPTRFLSTVQIGITSIGVLSGIVGQAALADPFSLWLQSVGINPENSDVAATALVVLVITYVAIVLGELVPKRLGQINAEFVASRVARPMSGLAALSRPFVHLLSGSTSMVLRLLGAREVAGSRVTEEEIHAVLAEGSQSGAIEAQEHQMVRNLFRLDDRKIASLMVPRPDVAWLDMEEPCDTLVQKVIASAHARFPVCRGEINEVVGVVSAKRLLARALAGDDFSLESIVEPAVFVPETLTGMELLDSFRSSHEPLALVVDEYGEVQGLVTVQDLLEAITGEFNVHEAGNAWATQRADGSWLLDGIIPIPELKDRLSLRAVPEEDRHVYHTLSGMLMLLLGRLPNTGDHVEWEGWRLEIVDMDGLRIDKVLAERLPGIFRGAPDDRDAG